MKKAVSLLLSLLMIVSVFSVTFVQASAAEVSEYFTITNTGFNNDEITYYVSLNPNQPKINSIILNFGYDSDVVEVVEEKSGPVGVKNNYGEFNPNVDGVYEKGVNASTDKFVMAFFNPNGVAVGDSAISFVKVTFKAIADNRPTTAVSFECVEYISDDGDASNDKTKATPPVVFAEDSFLTLNAVKNKEVLSNTDGLKFVWDEVTGAEWYKVYRKAEGATEWTVIAEQVLAPETSYVDKIEGDDLGKVFEYVAEPYNSYGSVPHGESGVKGKYFGTIDFIDAVMTETGAQVSWTALENADSYSLYQMAEGDEEWSFVKTVTETTCHSKTLESGKKYFFTVKAHSDGYLAETSADPKELVFLGSPDDVYAAISDEAITLTWDEVNGAESYNVYKKNASEESYAFVENITDVEFVDEDVINGELYNYYIQSVNSLTESVIGDNCTTVKKLAVTKNVTTELGKNCVIVKWDAVDFADGYKIFRKEVESTGWSAIGSSDVTEYRDMRVASGLTYVYAVATLSDGGIYEAENSEPSEEIFYIAAPVINSAVAYGDKITLSWKKVNGVELYDVYKYSVENEEWELLDSIDVNTYDDFDVIGGETYGYSVVSVIGDKTSLFDDEGVWVKYLSAPTGLTAENVFEGIELSWNQVAGADEYVVYHKVGSGSYQEIARLNTDETTYVHTSATAGQDNYYTVYARGGVTYSEPAEISIRYLSAPEIKIAELSSTRGYVTLTWGKIDGVDTYNIYRKACNATEWELLDTVAGSKNSYNDSKVFYTNDYEYTVQACYGDSYSAFDQVGKKVSVVAKDVASLRYVNNTWRCIVGTSYNYAYRGLVYYNGSYYYVANGYVDWNYNGFVPLNNEYYYVSAGCLNLNGDSLALIDGEWCYVKGGKLDPTGNDTLVNYSGDWYYVENGTVNWNYTNLVYFYGDWYYVENGKVNFDAITLFYFYGEWYYVENGKVNFNATTLCYFYGDWYYVENGKVNFNATTLCYFYGDWYYVEYGKVNFNVTTLFYFYGDWYYVENGKVNFNATTLVYFYGEWYYVENGKVNFNATTLVYYNNTWFYVENGKVNFNATTLVYYNGTWYYVEYGSINWYSDTLVYFYGTWYYVKGGTVAWNYTGYVNFYGANYYVVNGTL
ncbi:MAG: hypothetical protein IJO44_03745 [Clostridia bacterium]|nr:hypothetical protein [Clostridia bacterium]